MSDNKKLAAVKISEALEAIRSSATNSEIMERFGIARKGLDDIMGLLFRRNLITVDDLERRGFDAVPLVTTADMTAQLVNAPPGDAEDTPEFPDTVELVEMLEVESVAEDAPFSGYWETEE